MSRFVPIACLVAAVWGLASIVTAHDFDVESAQIAELIVVTAGATVADVGAGDGRFGEALARRIGESGHVFLTEIRDRELEQLRERVELSEMRNMSVVAGKKDDPALPSACCDAVLLRYVVHHMSEAERMFSGIRRSLRDEGLLLIVEKTEKGDGIEESDLVAQVRAAGFDMVSRHPDWGDHDGHYGVLFRPAP